MTRVAIAGLGAIGVELATRLAAVPGVELAAVSARDEHRAAEKLRSLGIDAPVVPLGELEPLADLVVECAPAALLPEIATPFLRAAKEVIVLSCGALLENPELLELAAEHGGTITVPTGALLGLDAVAACAEAEISSVTLTTRKPPAGLIGAPGLAERGIVLDADLAEPACVFAGTARDAVKGFPANLNVAVALALAGVGPERTEVEIWADPAVTRNTHTIVVRSTVADLTMTIENVPSENPRTGRITALSVVSLLRKRGSALRVGS
jgi:aspartate dehydrogenase